jgi:hypothetical protein
MSGEGGGHGWEQIEGVLWALYAVSKEYAVSIGGGGGGGSADVEILIEYIATLIGAEGHWGGGGEVVVVGGVDRRHPRLLETVTWIISSLAPVLVVPPTSPFTPPHTCPHGGLLSTPSPPSAKALVRALLLVYIALESPRPATARGAAVSFMKVTEKCAPLVVALGPEAYQKPLLMFQHGGPATVPLRLLRPGRESPNLVLLRGLLSIARALPLAQADEAFQNFAHSLCSSLVQGLASLDSLAGALEGARARLGGDLLSCLHLWAEGVASVSWRLRSFGILVDGAVGDGAVGVGKQSDRKCHFGIVGGGEGGGGEGRDPGGCSEEGRWWMLDTGLQMLQNVVGRSPALTWQGEVGEGAAAAAAETAWSLMAGTAATYIYTYMYIYTCMQTYVHSTYMRIYIHIIHTYIRMRSLATNRCFLRCLYYVKD